jgi:hypothetical protein
VILEERQPTTLEEQSLEPQRTLHPTQEKTHDEVPLMKVAKVPHPPDEEQ